MATCRSFVRAIEEAAFSLLLYVRERERRRHTRDSSSLLLVQGRATEFRRVRILH